MNVPLLVMFGCGWVLFIVGTIVYVIMKIFAASGSARIAGLVSLAGIIMIALASVLQGMTFWSR